MLEKFFRKIFFKIYSTIFPTFLAFRSEKLILKSFFKFFLLKSAKILAFLWILGTFSTKNWKPEYPRTQGVFTQTRQKPKNYNLDRPEPKKWYPNPTQTWLLLPKPITTRDYKEEKGG